MFSIIGTVLTLVPHDPYSADCFSASGQLSDRGLSGVYAILGISHWLEGDYRQVIIVHSNSPELRESIGYQSAVGYFTTI